MGTITYHNHQAQGDLGDSKGDSMAGDKYDRAVHLAVEAARSGISYKQTSGVQGRLAQGQSYLEDNKIDKLVFHASDEEVSDDCENCPEAFSVNIDFIRLQHESAMSIYMDALKSRGNDYTSIEPTPIPDASGANKDVIKANAFNAVMRDISAGIPLEEAVPGDEAVYGVQYLEEMLGTDAGLISLEDVVAQQQTIENSKLFASASKKAANAKRFIDDKLTESNYDEELNEFAASMFWHDYAVMFAPYMKEVDTTGLTSTGVLVEKTKTIWSFQNVHPLNHFYSPSTTYTDMGDYEGDIAFLSKNDLRSISDGAGESKEIDYVIDNFEEYRSVQGVEIYDENQYCELNQVIPCIRLFIKLNTDDAEALFGNKVKAGKSTHIAELLVAGGEVLVYKSLYPRYVNFSPYRKMSFSMPTSESLSSGRGLYSLCRTGQEIVDNALVGLLSSISKVSSYILEVNDDKIVEPDELDDDLDSDRPVIRTKGSGSYAAYGGNDRAISVVNIPAEINTFTSALLTGVELIEKVGLSAFALGQGNFQNVRSTGQSAILQVNGNKRFARVLTHQEDYVESPIMKYIWIASCISGKDVSITVDADVRVTSYSGFLQKESESDRVGLFMQNIVGFLNARTALESNGTDTGFYDSLLKQYVDSSGYDSSDIDIAPNAPTSASGALASAGTDVTSAPLENLDGRNNVPANINEVL